MATLGGCLMTEIDIDKTLDLASKAIALGLAVSPESPFRPIVDRAIQRNQELSELSQLSGLSINKVIEKIQDYPWAVDTILDFYRINGRFPNV